ncbi:MAG: hypothetical protein AB7I27_13675 [Bacteriovoracaceae bacterium]
MTHKNHVLAFQSALTIDLSELRPLIKEQKNHIDSESKNLIKPPLARTFIRILKQMPKQFKELYTVEDFAEKAIGVSKTTFEGWTPEPDTYSKPAFKSAWDRVKTIAQIQMSLVKIYQNKESIISASVTNNNVFNKTFFEIILSNDIEQQIQLKNYLEAIEKGM